MTKPDASSPKFNLPLTLLVPLALILAVALATWWAAYVDRSQVSEKLQQQTIDNMTLTASSLTPIFELALRANEKELIQEEIGALAANREYTFAVLTDENDQILHSMRLADVGKSLEQAIPNACKGSPFLQSDYLNERRRSLGGKVNLNEAQTLIATLPLALGALERELRPNRVGNLILIRDYSKTRDRELSTVNRNAFNRMLAISLFALGLGMFFHLAIARRLNRLAQVASQFGMGENDIVHTGVGGKDEVAKLAWSMDRMMADKATADRDVVESEQRLQAIMEAALDGIITIDSQGIIQSANLAGSKMFGYELKELVGHNVSMLMPTPYAEAHDGYLDDYQRTGIKKIIGIGREVTARTKSGESFPIDLSISEVIVGEETFFLGVVRDITERKMAEKSLRVRQRAIDSAVNGVVITDPSQPDNPIVYANPAVLEMTGFSGHEVLGKNCRFLQGDDRDQESLQELRSAIREERECRVVLRNYRKDGSLFWNELTVSPVRNEQGKVTNFVGIQANITDRKLAEERLAKMNEELEQRVRERTAELEETQQQLVQKERLATLGQVSGGIAHEIRNPLNAISTSAFYLLNAKQVDPKKQREHLERVDRQVKMINNVITALSDVAKLPAAKRSPFSLADSITRIAKGTSLPANVEVVLEIPDDLPKVLADEFQVPIVFRNLVRNARDAMPDGGTLTISAKADGKHVLVSVKDTGIGIAPDDLARITEPLYSTKARGMGLGLAISQAVLEKNGGLMDVTSEVDVGTEFIVKLEAAL